MFIFTILLLLLLLQLHTTVVYCFTATARTANSQISENRHANFEYEFTEKLEVGIVLQGTEVKSCRRGSVQLSDGICDIRDGECWLLNVHIDEWNKASMRDNHKPKRIRKLLLHKNEILKLEQRMLQRNQEIIPIRMYFNEKNFVKIEIGIGTKKSLNDKRDDIIKRDGEREIRRVMKGGYD